MTVGELRRALEGVDDDIEVMLNCDYYDWCVVRAKVVTWEDVSADGTLETHTFFYLDGKD